MINRVSVPYMDQLIGKELKVLDKGFVRLIDYVGDDSSIVQAARVSYGDGTKSVSQDAGLIDFLMRHYHTSPFEMCEIILHLKMPIFIARQVHRHRTASINELSARYSVIKDEFFLPEESEIRQQSKRHKQGRSESYDDNQVKSITSRIKKQSSDSFKCYQGLLEDDNLARELARTVLPQNTYTEFYWKIDLHNLFHFLRLRIAPGAQAEARAYAKVMLYDIVQHWVPHCFASFKNHRMNSQTLSENQMSEVKKLLDPVKVKAFVEENSTKRGEIRELIELLQSYTAE